MLKIVQTTRFNGEIRIGKEIVMTLTADISTETGGTSFLRQSILDQKLYQANRKECRKDIADFQELIYKLEDEF